MINSRTYDCKLSPLTNKSWDSVDIDNEHHIRMKTANEFFLLDANDFVYEGMANVRGAPVDIFSRHRQMTRGNRNETVSFYCKCTEIDWHSHIKLLVSSNKGIPDWSGRKSKWNKTQQNHKNPSSWPEANINSIDSINKFLLIEINSIVGW